MILGVSEMSERMGKCGKAEGNALRFHGSVRLTLPLSFSRPPPFE